MTFVDVPDEVDVAYRACHSSNHWLEPIPVVLNGPPTRGVVRVWWRCVRCTTERHDELHAVTLELVGRRYVYPDGYLSPKGASPSRASWRASYLRAVGVLSDRQATANRRFRKKAETEP